VASLNLDLRVGQFQTSQPRNGSDLVVADRQSRLRFVAPAFRHVLVPSERRQPVLSLPLSGGVAPFNLS